MGDPPGVEQEVEALKQTLREALDRIPLRRIGAGLAALVVVWITVSFLFRPAQDLQDAADRAAQALAAGDLAYLRSIAAPGTTDDVARWFEVVHPRLVQARERWFGQKEVAQAYVIQEDQDERKGTVGIVIQPVTGGARDVTLADPTAATAAASSPFSVETTWTRGRWGRWKLDGEALSTQVQSTP